jgi:hypothetical protein
MSIVFKKLPTFDELMDLAQNQPEMLSELQKKWSQEIIDHAPASSRAVLESLHYKINVEVERAKNPYDAMIRLSSLTWDKFIHLSDRLKPFDFEHADYSMFSVVPDNVIHVDFRKGGTGCFT